MLFSSVVFLCVFFPLFFAAYYLAGFFCTLYAKKKKAERIPTAPRNAVLLVLSLIFYAWGELLNIWLLIASIVVNYILARLISRFSEKRAVKNLLMISDIVFNIGLLIVYKYLPLIVGTVNGVFSLEIAIPSVVMPIGISFFTFRILSYVVDVYRKDVAVQKNIFTVAVYLCAFPQLIAGPIVRYSDVEKQLFERNESFGKTAEGLKRFIIGLSKKVIIANTVAAVADSLYSYGASEIGVAGEWIAAVAYTLQIYFDFSGYSDMAIGMGRMMGFDYLENFRYPYSASSVTDFWRRWHISLSSFFKDYVYIPLGGNRVRLPRWILNTMIVWMLTGLWHGASYNFILWGLYYGILLILEKKVFGRFLQKHRIVSRIYTVLAFVFGWVIFRVENIKELGKTLFAMFGGYGTGRGSLSVFTILQRSECGLFFIIIVFVGIIISLKPSECEKGFFSLRRKLFSDIMPDKTQPLGKAFSVISPVLCVILLVICIVFLETGSYNPFIYFRF